MFKTIKYGFEEGQRSFDLIPYKSWQEREILLAVSLNEEEFTTNGIDKIFEYLTTNIIPKEKYDISKEEKIYLLYMLRSISIGESINTKNICSECNKPFDIELEINDFLKPPKEFNKTLSIDNFTLYFKDTFKKSEIEEFFYKIKNNINSIETTDIDEIKEFIENLDIEFDEVLINFINNNKTKFEFINNKKCFYCKAEHIIEMNNDTFVISSLSEDSLISLYKTISNLIFHGQYTKTDIDNMIPFERSIFVSLLETNLKELQEARG